METIVDHRKYYINSTLKRFYIHVHKLRRWIFTYATDSWRAHVSGYFIRASYFIYKRFCASWPRSLVSYMYSSFVPI